MSETHQFCTFFLQDLYFGVDVKKVQEVIRYQEMTKVPLSSPLVRGLINLRGQIVSAVDLRRRLGLPDRENGRLPMNVVVRSGEEAVSLLVDEIGDVMEVEQDCFEPPPETLDGATRDLVPGVYKLKDRLLLALDIEKTIRIETAR